ncbi:intercellular trafficking and secretion [Lithohypha guttulata]|uniref:intercellular trafficking and secretion n=1 Tax=Lithohypha guttulata TaxID=1690604 RepID=UPI002DDE3220|nr:intercellular trafficking and secretion [Lithohypha guttulata]
MEEESGFDSVQWDRADQTASSPTGPEFEESSLPHRPAGNRRTSTASSEREPQAGENADAIDLAGIGEEGTLDCVVGSPRKENDGTKDAYVSYEILTQTDFQSFMKSEFSVRRRFTDFVFLRHALYKEYQAAAIPPLPEKNNMAYVRGDRFSPEFTQRRAWSLHRFIKRITQHPILRRAPIFLLFLETQDWNQQMKLRPSRSITASEASTSGPTPPQGFFDNVADTMLNAFSKVHKPDRRFLDVMERLNKLDEDLNHVEKIVARVVRREGDLEQDYADLAVNMRKLTPMEPGIEPQVLTFAGCVEETSRGWKSLKEHTDQSYLGSLRDMDAYIASIKALLRTREQKQLDFEGLTDYLAKASQERDTLVSHAQYGTSSSLNPATFIRHKVEDMRGVDHEQARRERARKLELRIEELNREVDIAKSTSEMFDQQVLKEVNDFERIKGLEFRDCLGSLAGQNIDFYKGVIDTWERFLGDVDADNKTLKGKGVTA